MSELTANQRRIIRNALRAYASCPIVDREECVSLLYRLEADEQAGRLSVTVPR